MNYVITYGGGLGDLLDQIYRNRPKYNSLMNLEVNDNCLIGLICHNPFCIELFKWHPKVSQLEIRNPGYCLPPGRLGLPKEKLPPTGSNEPILIYPSEKDKLLLTQLTQPYVVLSCGAGELERSIPQEVVEAIILGLKDLGVTTVGIGRDYHRNHRLYDVCYGSCDFDLSNKLSVAGTIELISKCAGLVCSHSAGHCIGNHIQCPQLLLYPESVKERYGYWRGKVGQIYRGTHGTFAQYDKDMLQRFVQKCR